MKIGQRPDHPLVTATGRTYVRLVWRSGGGVPASVREVGRATA
jgi:hypothetical protein